LLCALPSSLFRRDFAYFAAERAFSDHPVDAVAPKVLSSFKALHDLGPNVSRVEGAASL
jgi:hypothetical protein